MNTSTVKVGMLVRVYNQEHIWHNEIGIVRDIRGVFFRVEILGKLVWMPKHWFILVEDQS